MTGFAKAWEKDIRFRITLKGLHTSVLLDEAKPKELTGRTDPRGIPMAQDGAGRPA
jgi:hypothetical protein